MRRVLLTILLGLPLFFILVGLIYFPVQAERLYGPAGSNLGYAHRLEYSARLIWYDGLLTVPHDPSGMEQSFRIAQGESVSAISFRLKEYGLISNSQAFYDYLIYAGMDTTIQAGEYKLSPSLSIIEIASELQDATPEEITFVVLPGWRAEEIAASIPTSGLDMAPGEFLIAVQAGHKELDYLPASAGAEGFLYPDTYLLNRNTTAAELVMRLTRNFITHLTPELQSGFAARQMDLFNAIILASLIEREAVREQEQPVIASVFFNRLASGLKLDSDPTIQYALGYNPDQETWWTNPLSAQDLQINSPYNTYLYNGLPPGPIANPGAEAIRAVAFPADTSFYYFRARCDDSGYHVFAQTFEEHLRNACP